jgi:hypothetical protein
VLLELAVALGLLADAVAQVLAQDLGRHDALLAGDANFWPGLALAYA